MVGWHSSSGSLGASKNANNTGYIGFEICEDNLKNEDYFAKIYKEAVELCAYLCQKYLISPEFPNLICHSEGASLGIANNHADVMHWFPKYGKSMDSFRRDVKNILEAESKNDPKPTEDEKTGDKAIWNYLTGKGLNAYSVAGIMGNLFAESALNPINVQNSYEKTLNMSDREYTDRVDSGDYTEFTQDRAGYGLAQWTYWSRKQALLDYARSEGKSIGDLLMQLDFLWMELQDYSSLMQTLNYSTSVDEASRAFHLQYERPADKSEEAQLRRTALAQKYYEKYANMASSITKENKFPYAVKVTSSALNVRENPSIKSESKMVIRDQGVYTITDESTGEGATMWGKLKSGAGWISLDYTERK
jgi:hypothetical protein